MPELCCRLRENLGHNESEELQQEEKEAKRKRTSSNFLNERQDVLLLSKARVMRNAKATEMKAAAMRRQHDNDAKCLTHLRARLESLLESLDRDDDLERRQEWNFCIVALCAL